MAHPTKCSAELAAAFAERLRRGATFKYAALVNHTHPDVAHNWMVKGRTELAQRAAAGADPDTSVSVFAQFAEVVDAAMGEAVLSAAERLWTTNPAMWLRWSYARTEFYPLESAIAEKQAVREREANAQAQHAAEREAHVAAIIARAHRVMGMPAVPGDRNGKEDA